MIDTLDEQSAVERLTKSEISEERFMLSCVLEERDAIRVKLKGQTQTSGSFQGSLSRKLPCAKVGKDNILPTTVALLEYFMNSLPLLSWADQLVSLKLPFLISKSFKWPCKGFVLGQATGTVNAHQSVSAAGYLVLKLLIAWGNYELPTGQLRASFNLRHSRGPKTRSSYEGMDIRLEDKSGFREGSNDTNLYPHSKTHLTHPFSSRNHDPGTSQTPPVSRPEK